MNQRALKPPLTPESWMEYFGTRFVPIPETGCWIWLGAQSPSGYGQIQRGSRKRQLVHRISYELLRGPIPAGLTIDHLCRQPLCVNPDHMEPVTGRVNTLRGRSPHATNARKTHCINGHEFTTENTYLGYPGKRKCWECIKANSRRYHARHRDERNAKARAYKIRRKANP